MKITFHRDGTVTLWNVYTQQWERLQRPSDSVLASLNCKDRARVVKHCNLTGEWSHMEDGKTRFHDDGTVTIWNVYKQQWQRTERPSDRVLASLDQKDKARVIKHCNLEGEWSHMEDGKPKYHDDGTVTLWNVYLQQWQRTERPSDRVLASLDQKDKARVIKHCNLTGEWSHMEDGKPKYHRDGTVTLWNVYTQQWQRTRRPSDRVLASLNCKDKTRVIKHCNLDED